MNIKNIRPIRTIICAASLSLALCNCTERELEIRRTEGILHIDLLWPESEQVEGSRIRLYADGKLVLREDVTSAGWQGTLPAGTYSVLAINTDYQHVQSINEEDFAACSKEAEQNPDGTLRSVKHIFRAGEKGIRVEAGRETWISLQPKRADRHVRFLITTGFRTGDYSDMKVLLTGVVPSVRIWDGGDSNLPTRSMQATAIGGNGSWTADMSCFGWRGGNQVRLTAQRTDGTPVSSDDIDISERLAALSAAGGTVELTVKLNDGETVRLTVTVGSWGTGTGSAEIM